MEAIALKEKENTGSQIDIVLSKIEYSNQDENTEKILQSFILTRDSEKTRKDYSRHLMDFVESIRKPLPEIAPQDLVRYRENLLKDGRGTATHAQALSAIRSFLKWSRGLELHLLSYDVVSQFLKVPKSKVVNPYKTLSDVEIARVFGFSDSKRDKAMFALMTGAGLRVSEVSNLKLVDFYQGTGGWSIIIRQGKGNKDRIVPLLNDVFEYVQEYADETVRGFGKLDEYVFKSTKRISKQGNLTIRAIENSINDMIQNANIDKEISPHSLRHSFAFRALKAGTKLVELSNILGHSSISVTQRYVDHMDMDEVRLSLPSLPTYKKPERVEARA
jgi:site-specific recombinase XerD